MAGAFDVAGPRAVWYLDERLDEPQKEGNTRFRVEASVGNADGVFDAAHNFGEGAGEEAAMAGTPREIGDAVARCLASPGPDDRRAMRYGKSRLFVQPVVTPEQQLPAEPGS